MAEDAPAATAVNTIEDGTVTPSNNPPIAEGDWKSHFPVKFQRDTFPESVKAMSDAYKNVESEASRMAQQKAPVSQSDSTEKGGVSQSDSTSDFRLDPKTTTPTNAAEFLSSMNLDGDKMVAEFRENGKLGEDAVRAFEAKGIPADVVQGYLESQVIRGEQKVQNLSAAAETIFGSMDEFRASQRWASQNLSPSELQTINSLIESGSADSAKIAFREIKARHQEAGGVGRGPRHGGQVGPGAETGGFRSQDEQNAALMDERYSPVLPSGAPNPKYDPQFQRQTQMRLLATN